MRLLLIPQLLSAVTTAALFPSCASVSVKGVSHSRPATPQSRPAHIYVQPFSVAGARVKEHTMRKHHGALASEAQQLVAAFLASELSKNVAPASILAPGEMPRRDGWLVSGKFTRIAEGSRLLRMGVGLGMGGTKMETAVEVRALPPSNPPFLRFETTGGSGATPGAVSTPIPFSSAPVALVNSKEGVTDDAARTARMIRATIATYMVQRGWLDSARTEKPKTLAQ